MTDRRNHLSSLRRLSVWACAATWVCEFALTHIPANDLPKLDVGDWFLHSVAFIAVSGTFLATLSAFKVTRLRRITLTAVIMPVFAAFDELSQPLANRTASVNDWLADMVGTMIALVVVESALAIGSALTSHKLDQSP